MMPSVAISELWARRPRLALTCGPQVDESSVIAEIDLLHWRLGLEWGRAFLDAAFGPFHLSLCAPGGLMERLPDGDAAEALYNEARRQAIEEAERGRGAR